jgi:hypothetical protein
MTTQAQALAGATRFLLELRKLHPRDPIDVEIEWPPDENGVSLFAWCGMLVYGRQPTRVGKHFLDSIAWEGTEIDVPGILTLLVKAGQGESLQCSIGPPIYLRVHDSASSIALDTGEQIWDRKRPDRVPPPRKPVANTRGSPVVDPREGQELRRGGSITAARSVIGAAADANAAELLKKFLAIGVRVGLDIDGDTIAYLAYIQPYPRKVCGVWIGASAAEVQEILGIAEDEFKVNRGRRAWVYDHDGHLSVSFDDNDFVNAIGR